MRLLTTDSEDKISVVGPFARNEAPRYAILSHTWGPDSHEVKLQDLQDGTAQSKPGWQKIDFCQKQAAADDIDYFWIDTCCIDKTSSAELSEAINSMYRWYRDSARCYAFLEDVTTYNTQKWEDMLMSSRWLTRGWTLQELLAPSSVQFFSQEGRLLGDKDSLSHILSKATTIPVAALKSLSPTRFSRHEMMRWVQCRSTKREEDKAYCMLGLLQVTLPVNYGEGYEDACARLDEAIQRKFGSSMGLGQREEIGSPTGLSEADKAYLRSLWFADMAKRQMRISRPVSGTSSWLFEHRYYRLWTESYSKRNGENLLWIKGNPGVGKSVLMKEAVRRISITIENSRGIVVAHFLNGKGHDLEKSTIGLYRSLLYQLLQHNRTYLRKLSKSYEEEAFLYSSPGERLDSMWTEDSLGTMLASILSDMSDRCITIFIDALDECSTGALRQQASFWRELAGRSPNLRLCISCRHFPHLFEGLFRSIHVEDNNGQDIDEYVRQRVLPYRTSGNGNRAFLRQRVTTQARGVFLWAVLVLDQLLGRFDDGCSVNHLFSMLKVVPDSLVAIFERILADIRSDSRAEENLSVLHWALLARKTLRVDEWHHIMAVTHTNQYTSLRAWRSSDNYIEKDDQLERKLRAMSRGLIEITTDLTNDVPDTDSSKAWAGSLDLAHGGSRFVQVIHSSVRDHLAPVSQLDFDLQKVAFIRDGHIKILQGCLRYLELAELDEYVDARLRALDVAFRVRMSHTSWIPTIARAETDVPASEEIRDESRQLSGHSTIQQSNLRHSETNTPALNAERNNANYLHARIDSKLMHDEEGVDGDHGSSIETHDDVVVTLAGAADKKDFSLLSQYDTKTAALGTSTYDSECSAAPRETKRRHLSSPRDISDKKSERERMIAEVGESLITLDPAIVSWIESLESNTNHDFSSFPRALSTSSRAGESIASTHCTASTKVLGDHMALLPYITAHFWDHARFLADSPGLATEALIEQFCTPWRWRRWQAIDVSAPYAPEIDDYDLQCAYFKHLGLEYCVKYMQDRHSVEEQQRRLSVASRPLGSRQYQQAMNDAMERSLQRRGSVASFGSAGSHGSGMSIWG